MSCGASPPASRVHVTCSCANTGIGCVTGSLEAAGTAVRRGDSDRRRDSTDGGSATKMEADTNFRCDGSRASQIPWQGGSPHQQCLGRFVSCGRCRVSPAHRRWRLEAAGGYGGGASDPAGEQESRRQLTAEARPRRGGWVRPAVQQDRPGQHTATNPTGPTLWQR